MKGLIVFLLLASGAASAKGSIFCEWPGGPANVTNLSEAKGAHYVGQPFRLAVLLDADWALKYPNGSIQDLGHYVAGVSVTPQTTGVYTLAGFRVVDGICSLTDNVLAMPSVDTIVTSGTLWTATTITFSATVSGGEDPKTYLWSFGDGATSTAVSPTHSYNSAGSFTVNLTITDANGRKGSRQQVIAIADNPNVPGIPGPIVREYMGCGTSTGTYLLEWTPGAIQPSHYYLYKIKPTLPANAPWAQYWLTLPTRTERVPLNKSFAVEVSGCVSNSAATCGPIRTAVLPAVNCSDF